MTRQRHGQCRGRKPGRSLFPRTDLREDFFWPIEDHFNRLLNEFFGGDAVVNSIKSSKGYPKMDVVEEGDNFVIRAALPGVPPENVKVEVLPKQIDDMRYKTGIVRISGKMEEVHAEPEGSKALVRELRKSHFCRELELPENLVDEDPKACLRDGILKLTWKIQREVKAESPQVREIVVHRPEEGCCEGQDCC